MRTHFSAFETEQLLALPQALEIIFRHKITQEEARRLWLAGTLIGNESKNATAHVLQNAKLNGIETSVVVKQWKNCEDEPFSPQCITTRDSARQKAINEVRMHREAWRRFTPECRKHLSMPADMDFTTPPHPFSMKHTLCKASLQAHQTLSRKRPEIWQLSKQKRTGCVSI